MTRVEMERKKRDVCSVDGWVVDRTEGGRNWRRFFGQYLFILI